MADKGFGQFLRSWAGNLGDSLTGNPAYARSQQALEEQQRLMQAYEAKRQAELEDYEKKKKIDQQYSTKGYEGSIDEFQQAKQLGYIPKDLGYQDFLRLKTPNSFVTPPPVSIPYGAKVEGGDTGTGGLPRVQDEAGYNALPPGTTYIDPNGNVRKKGGPSQGGSGGFP